MKSERELAQWLAQNRLGRYAAAAEQDFFHAQLPPAKLPAAALTLSALETWWPACVCRIGPDSGHAHIVAALPCLPLADNSIHTLLLPHGLDVCAQHPILLQECFRVLQPYGRLVLSGFNPHSLWRFGAARAWCRHALPLPRTKQLLQSAGFTLHTGRFMVYAPPLPNQQRWRFMEAAGNRWWPQAAAVYGLSALKTLAPLTPAKQENLQTIEGLNWVPAAGREKCPQSACIGKTS